MKKKLICIGMVCIMLLGLLCGCGNHESGCKTSDEVIKTVVTGIYKDRDVSKIYNLVYKEMQAVIAEQAEENGIYGTDEVIAEFQSDTDEFVDNIDENIGEGWKYSYEITEEKRYVENAEDKNYDILKFNHKYREDGIENFTAEEGKEIRFTVSYKTSDGKTATYKDETKPYEDTGYYILAKVDGNWYLMEFWSPDWLELSTL